MSLATAHDRALLDAADRHLARSPRCPCCVEPFDADAGVELHADEAALLRLPADAVVCPSCAADAREDLAMLFAQRELGRLRWRWQQRAIRAAGGVA